MRLEILAVLSSIGAIMLENDANSVKNNIASWGHSLGFSPEWLAPANIDFGLRLTVYATLFVSLLLTLRKRMKKPEKPAAIAIDNSVKSVNQSGGITARNVTIGNRQRKLDEDTKAVFLEKLDRSIPIDITVAMNDSEADRYAHEIKSFLVEHGYSFKYKTMLYESMSGGRGRPYLYLGENICEITIGPDVDVSDSISFLGIATRPVQ